MESERLLEEYKAEDRLKLFSAVLDKCAAMAGEKHLRNRSTAGQHMYVGVLCTFHVSRVGAVDPGVHHIDLLGTQLALEATAHHVIRPVTAARNLAWRSARF